ncbi:unnamed protein product [Cylicocyclus nassatus]|uniref:G-protein coupled receptors family 1 profile domain-containing protein n=1 Tax=Cylicocyclus nassatus TaxID=53992 RepID=A0AA36H2W5_CYLNA|nr:unnamed protein product [Cylicocyclus nassatus]
MRTDESIVSAEVIIFFIVGVFGNFNLLWMTVRRKSLQSKPGILLGINAISHMICLFGETSNAAFLISHTSVSRRDCFLIISPYIFTISHQAVMTLAISADLLYALLFPIWYQVLPTLSYIITIFGICSVYALFVLISGLMNLDDEIIRCNVPLGKTAQSVLLALI